MNVSIGAQLVAGHEYRLLGSGGTTLSAAWGSQCCTLLPPLLDHSLCLLPRVENFSIRDARNQWPAPFMTGARIPK